MKQTDLDKLESGERELEGWEIEKMCRESDEDGCLIMLIMIIFAFGFILGFFMKGWF